jgi:predicted TIM-barrel fold metal-dependent hydrolase
MDSFGSDKFMHASKIPLDTDWNRVQTIKDPRRSPARKSRLLGENTRRFYNLPI